MPAFANKCPKCGTKVKIRSLSLVGKKARCPKCGTAFPIKAPPALKTKTGPKPPSEEFSFLGRITPADLAPLQPAEDDPDAAPVMTEEEEQAAAEAAERQRAEEKRKRKQAEQRRAELKFVATVIGVGMLVLLALGFAAWQILPALFKGEERLAWMPDDIEGFLEIKPNELWEASALGPLREADLGVRLKAYFDARLSPIAWSEVRRIAVGFPPIDSPNPEPVFVLYANSSFDVPRVKSQAGGFREVSHGGQTYLVGGEPPRAACFPQPDVLVYGSEAQIMSAIDRGGASAATSRFPLPVPHTIIFSTTNPARFGAPSLTSVLGRDITLAADAQGLIGVTLAANVSRDFQINGALSYDKAEAAAALVTKIEKQVAEKLEQMGESSSQAAVALAGGGEQLKAAQEELLESLSVSQSDTQVRVKLTIPGFFVGHSLSNWSTFASNLFPDAFAP